MKRLLSALLAFIFAVPAFAASNSNPGLYYGQVPTPAQWNSYFSAKLDYSPGGAYSFPYWDSSNNFVALPPNTSTTPEFLTSTGTGSAAQQPSLTGSTGSGNVVLSSGASLTDVSITTGILLNGAYAGSYSTGMVMDYSSGGRISVDGTNSITFYQGGLGGTQLAQLSTLGLYVTNGLGIGAAAAANQGIAVSNTLSGATNQRGVLFKGIFNHESTAVATPFYSNPSTEAVSYTITVLRHFAVSDVTLGSGSSVTSQVGFFAGNLASGTNNYGFQTTITSGANNLGFYNSGNADNNLGTGNTYIGSLYNSSNNHLWRSSTSPTITSGFGTSPSIVANGTSAFRITVGSGGTDSSGVIGMPTASTGWNCFAQDITTTANAWMTKLTASSATSVTLTNYNAGSPQAWTAGDVLEISCFAY